MDKHDKVGVFGFNVPPEQLAHDLTMLKLYKSSDITNTSNNNAIYDMYTETLREFTVLIDDKTRYDSTFNG